MADDQTNPFTLLGMMQMMQPNKYTSPQYQNQPLPLPGFYGTPTDAQGKPIQSFLDAQTQHDAWDAANPAPAAGTTLNSTPANQGLEAQGSQAAAMQNLGYGDWAMLDPTLASSPIPGQTAGPGSVGYQEANYDKTGPQMMTLGANGLTPTNGGSTTAAPPAPTNPYDMRQAYLDALSNPGKVTTPGASVPQASPLGTPSVLNSFLAANPSGGSSPSNQGFFDTLNKLRAS